MMLTSALGITFIFIVDAANLFWISQLGDPQMVAAIGYAFAIQFFSVSTGIGMMIAATALVARSIGQKAHLQARQQATAGMIVTTIVQTCIAAFIIGFRHDLLALVGAPMIPQHWRRVIWR
jgi:Na+-driven multidrug efflux pump